MSTSYALYQSTQVKLVPYIVEVDKLGTAVAAGTPQQIEYADPRVVRATLETLETAIGDEMERTALILVGKSIGAEDFDESRLYAGDYDRRYRPVGTHPRFPETA